MGKRYLFSVLVWCLIVNTQSSLCIENKENKITMDIPSLHLYSDKNLNNQTLKEFIKEATPA